jgi:hypothetical protein
MPQVTPSTTTASVIRLWKERRGEILKELAQTSPELVAEYQKLGRYIRATRAAENNLLAIRRSLPEHRQKLVEFLKEHGPATRAEITAKVGIPPGSLSTVLLQPDFQQHGRGFWALKEQGKKSGTSATTSK